MFYRKTNVEKKNSRSNNEYSFVLTAGGERKRERDRERKREKERERRERKRNSARERTCTRANESDFFFPRAPEPNRVFYFSYRDRPGFE